MPLKLCFSNLFRCLRHSPKPKPTAELELELKPGHCPICKQPEALRWRDYVRELYDNCRFLNHYLAVEDPPFIPSAEQDRSRSSPTPQAMRFSSPELAFRRISPTPQVNPLARPGEPQFYLQFPSLIQDAIRFHRPTPAPSHTTTPARCLTTTAATVPTPISTPTYHSLADEYIDALVLELEELQEDREDVDCEYSVSIHPSFIFLPKNPLHKTNTYNRPASSPSPSHPTAPTS